MYHLSRLSRIILLAALGVFVGDLLFALLTPFPSVAHMVAVLTRFSGDFWFLLSYFLLWAVAGGIAGTWVGKRTKDDGVVGRERPQTGFTLIELLIVIGIIAVLSVVVILAMNPAELLRQARDANRLSDMDTINKALALTQLDGLSLGTANTVYVSLPDPTATTTLGDQCQGLGLPTLPATYAYHCAASSTYSAVNGTGWIPVAFRSASMGSPLSSLPVDPVNTSSTRNYYTYTTDGSHYEVTATMESMKYKLGGGSDVVGPDGGTLATAYEKGTKLGLEPMDYGDPSLVGLWPFDEGTGSSTYDWSGNGNTGTWYGTPTGTSGYYSAGKVGPWAGTFVTSSSNYVGFSGTNDAALQNAKTYTFVAWVYLKNLGLNGYAEMYVVKVGGVGFMYGPACAGFEFAEGVGSFYSNCLAVPSFSFNSWHHVVMELNQVSGGGTLYLDGTLQGSVSFSPTIPTGNSVWIGSDKITGNSGDYMNGYLDDVRLYNRALSAAEISAMYSGGK